MGKPTIPSNLFVSKTLKRLWPKSKQHLITTILKDKNVDQLFKPQTK